jgi:hypothetical protein
MSLQLRNCLCDKVICTRERQGGPPQSSPAIAAKRRRMVFFRSLSEQLQRLKLCVFQCRDHELTLPGLGNAYRSQMSHDGSLTATAPFHRRADLDWRAALLPPGSVGQRMVPG